MLDPKLLADAPDVVKDHLTRRGAADLHALVDRWTALATRRGELVSERDGLRADRNRLSKEIGARFKAGDREGAETLKAEVSKGNERIAVIEEELALVEGERDDVALQLPNVLAADVPTGGGEADNELVRTWGTPRSFDFEPESHVEIGAKLGILDLDRSAKLSGARFAVLRGMGARLERGLVNFFLDRATGDHGYEELMVPYLVQRHTLEGTGQLPKFEADLFKLAGELNGSDGYLIPTAEVPVTNLHREEILEAAELPRRYAAFTPCFRSEAGSAGRDVRGIIRQHQFHKVELVWVTTPEQADEAHETLTRHAEGLLQALELPYRVMKLCSGDISFGAHRCYDLEVWLPSQQGYREISSCSSFDTFQTRRMKLRYRPEPVDGKKQKPRLAATLNGSGLAVGRTLVALLENGQQADGSVVIPEALRSYVGGIDRLLP